MTPHDRAVVPKYLFSGGDTDGEHCDNCGRTYGDAVWWCPDNYLWRSIYKHLLSRDADGGGLLCPSCFEKAAQDLRVLLIWEPRTYWDPPTDG